MSRLSTNDESMRTLEEIVVTDQAEVRKLETKLKKMKMMLSESLEPLEQRLMTQINERYNKLEVDMVTVTEDTEQNITELRQRFDGLENCDIVNITRRLSTARGKINEIIEKTSELDIQLKEISRDKTTNLLLHGLAYKVSANKHKTNISFL